MPGSKQEGEGDKPAGGAATGVGQLSANAGACSPGSWLAGMFLLLGITSEKRQKLSASTLLRGVAQPSGAASGGGRQRLWFRGARKALQPGTVTRLLMVFKSSSQGPCLLPQPQPPAGASSWSAVARKGAAVAGA